MPFREAVAQLETLFSDTGQVFDFLWLRMFNGLLPITCEALIYERADGGPLIRQMYEWPDETANLAEQMRLANHNPLAGFRWAAISGDVTWVDVSGEWPVNALAVGIHVERTAVSQLFTTRVTGKSRKRLKPFDRYSPQDDIESWYKARIATAPPMGYKRPEDEAAAEAVGIGRDRLRDMRLRLAPAKWQANGRRKAETELGES